MWLTLLVMAVAVSFEPFRLGMTVLMLSRPRPGLQLLVFLCGGFVMGIAVGLVVLFGLRGTVLGAAQFTLPRVQCAIGVLALVIAAVLVSKVRAPGNMRWPTIGPSLWVAWVAGMGIALPSVDYLAALAIILVSGCPAATQVGALLFFNVVAFAVVEIPAVAFLVAPERTRGLLAAFNGWVQRNRRRNMALVLAVVGCVLVAVGIAGI
ncbi:GAP family protein [Mycobacterium sp. NPDC050853]|uniref:GAP family protein n=1 Tax=Mycobacterium sp. NPDC050853 TaxID=3155160 RepID=UPI0034103EB0